MITFETVYDNRVAKLMEEVCAICKEYGIPMVASFQLSNEEDPIFCSFILAPENSSMKIKTAAEQLLSKTEIPLG
jgi:hypothetical protein